MPDFVSNCPGSNSCFQYTNCELKIMIQFTI
nr:MAG TPA: hypothetical protein [Caudoviricetes sp.]